MRLKDIRSPRDLKGLSQPELEDLADQIRREIIRTVSERGGHLASNLGVVELTLALHRAFDMPEDKIVFDVGHQSYVHKLITGRYAQFSTLRSFGGLAGFPKRGESEYDVFETGHSSTAISAALGMARARDLRGETHQVVAVVGDGALTGGMCYEAMNDCGSSKTRLIIVLNDNEMSIAPNVGALSVHLTELRVSHGWASMKKRVRSRLLRVPGIGKPIYRFIHWGKKTVRQLLVDDSFFGALGFRYYGPVDGHDIEAMERVFRSARAIDEPCVIHVLTQKGRGWDKSEAHPDRYHGVGPFDLATGEPIGVPSVPGFGEVMADELADMADGDGRVTAITAAMAAGTGLDRFRARHPDRMFDVGITEEHAVTMAAGLAAAGMRPYFAVYASFFQRGYDQMIHDVAMQRLPVTFLLDRAGLVGEDGQTHHGVFDLASMLPVPGMTVLAPRDLRELRAMLRWTLEQDDPVAIRYGRSGIDQSAEHPFGTFRAGRWETLTEGGDVTLLAVGSMVEEALRTAELLAGAGVRASVVSCSTVSPMDEALLLSLWGRPLVTMEEHVLQGGFGSAVCLWCARHGQPAPMLTLGIDGQFVTHGSRDRLLAMLGLDPAHMAERIRAALKEEERHG